MSRFEIKPKVRTGGQGRIFAFSLGRSKEAEALYEVVRKIATSRHISIAELIRQMIYHCLAEMESTDGETADQ